MGVVDIIPEPETKGSFDPRKQDAEDRSGMGALRVVLVGFALVVATAVGYAVAPRPGDARKAVVETVAAERGDLTVSIIAGGVLRAMEHVEIRNDVFWSGGRRLITSVVEEGTVITKEDVAAGKVLLELDSADVGEFSAQAAIWALQQESGLQQAEESLTIQKKQSESNVARARLRLKFDRIELARYLGNELAAEVEGQEDYDFDKLGEGLSAAAQDDSIDGGQALQELRVYDWTAFLAEARLAVQEDTVRWAISLAAKGFVEEQKLAADTLRRNELRVQRDAAVEERRLFLRYALPKRAEQRYGWVTEARRSLARVEARARSELAQAEARLLVTKANYELQSDDLRRATERLSNCTIRATQTGRIIYPPPYDGIKPISKGARRHPSEVLLTIPDYSSIAARVRIHETDIQKVKVGQRAIISLEAAPERTFAGTVVEVSPIATPGGGGLNPEIKIYETDVAFDEVPEGITPGMTATAEIIVAELQDVVCVPVEAVAAYGVERVCLVPGEQHPRPVQVGLATGKFVEIRSGLEVGDVVIKDGVEALLHEEVEAPSGQGGVEGRIPTAAVRRGPMKVTVCETGAIWSMEPIQAVNEVEGYSQIAEVIDEGTVITEQDVADGKILFAFDLEERTSQRKRRAVDVLNETAAHVQAREDREIRIKQNESDVAAAELRVRFARMDLERYVGADLATEMGSGVDLASLAGNERLGGRAKQNLRDRERALLLAEANLADSTDTFSWTKRLASEGFVESTRVERDRLRKQRAEVTVAERDERLRLFRTYTLSKEAERARADYVEAERALGRVTVQAESRLMQADATLKTAESKLELAQERLEKMVEMIEKSTVRAMVPGIVVYGDAGKPGGAQERTNVKIGGSFKENDVILQVPDLNSLAARINIPETVKDDVKVGQKAVIILDAALERTYTGVVARVSPMASTENAWLNPDAKVYETDVALDEVPERFVPGMSAQVEITVAELDDALYVPAQCVVTHKNLAYCWVKTPDGPKVRVVDTGHLADRYTEIVDGLTAREEVYLAPPADADVEGLDVLVKDKEEADAKAAAEHREQEAARRAEEGESGEAGGQGGEGVGAIDWEKLAPKLQEIQALTGEEQAQKWQELLDSLPPDQREQLEAMAGQQ